MSAKFAVNLLLQKTQNGRPVNMQPAPPTERKFMSWDERFQELAEFHAVHGHCRVSRHAGSNKSLGEWIKSQRKYRREQKLTTAQEAKLNSIGFEWSSAAPVAAIHGTAAGLEPANEIWEDRFIELVAFAAEFGHTRVPKEWPVNTRLASWVSSQRTYFRKGTLNPEHQQRLTDIGFVWDARPAASAKADTGAKLDAWDLQFAELATYKSKHGTTNVPRHWKEDSKLADWVADQRKLMLKGQLPEDKIFWLNELGFQWQGSTADLENDDALV